MEIRLKSIAIMGHELVLYPDNDPSTLIVGVVHDNGADDGFQQMNVEIDVNELLQALRTVQ